jgi:predicted metal-binding membrane protein
LRVGVLLALAAAAWLVTGARMDGMDMGPGSELGGLGWFAVTWVAMMAAMMLPALGPAVVRQRGSSGLFVAGYLLPWAAAGVAGYAVVEAVRALDPSFLAWNQAGRYLAAGVIVGAAVYQLTPVKDSALRRCRGAGAPATGVKYGGFCVTCCWALMAALFALGVMSLIWMALIAVLITAERLLPWRVQAARGVALVLVVLGLAVAVAPASMPGLTIPSGMDHSMGSMEAR